MDNKLIEIYAGMTPEEKARLRAIPVYQHDCSAVRDIKERYGISWNDVRALVGRDMQEPKPFSPVRNPKPPIRIPVTNQVAENHMGIRCYVLYTENAAELTEEIVVAQSDDEAIQIADIAWGYLTKGERKKLHTFILSEGTFVEDPMLEFRFDPAREIKDYMRPAPKPFQDIWNEALEKDQYTFDSDNPGCRDIWDAANMSVKDICAAAHLSQKALSDQFCIPYRTVQDWYSGRSKCPDYTRLMMIRLLDLL